jgi:adenylate kinase
VTTGELLKNAIAQQSQLGMEAKELQDAGRTVTEDIILGLLREHLLNPSLDDGFILDGFPRNLLQALTLDELLYEIGLPLDLVILIDIESDTLMERLVGRRSCTVCGVLYNDYQNPPIVDGVCDICGGRLHQRTDDNEETISNRIHVFDHLIAPLITHYGKRDLLARVDGNGNVESVFKAVLEVTEQNMERCKAALSVGMSSETPQALSGQDQEPGQREDRLAKVADLQAISGPEEAVDRPIDAVSDSQSEQSSSAVGKTPKSIAIKKTKKRKAKVAKKSASAATAKAKKKAKASVRSAKATGRTAKKKVKTKAKAEAKTAKKSSAAVGRKKAVTVSKRGSGNRSQAPKKTKSKVKKSAGKKLIAKKVAAKKVATKAKKTVSNPKKKLTKKSRVSQVKKKAGGRAANRTLPKQQAVKNRATKKQAKKKHGTKKKSVQKKRVGKKR